MMATSPKPVWFVLTFALCVGRMAWGQTEPVDQAIVDKLKEEGTQRSQVMKTVSMLTDVYGPRLTAAPETRRAGEWVQSQLTEWGLQNANLETWGPFGRGWSLESVTVNLVEPTYAPLIAYPKAWSPSTPKKVRGEPIYLDANSEADLEKYRGKLRHAIVLISPPRDVPAGFEPLARRQTDERLLQLANADSGPRGTSRSTSSRPTGSSAPSPMPAASSGSSTGGSTTDPRRTLQLQTDKWQLAYEEGAAVVLEPGRGDGGTVFVSSATMPRAKGDSASSGSPFSRGPRPWAVDAPEILPQAVMAVEHYNRLVRMLQNGAHPVLEIDIASRYHVDELNSFNVVAEIPGTDLKDEIVMLGAHFDSWHSGTGATDNAIGCAVALEAVRLLQAIGVKPRRTIRIALWTGEEQGLFGSRAYVTEHFGSAVTPPSPPQNAGGERPPAPPERRRTQYELKAAHEKFAAYFNLDNGAGKIRGIYLQGNEQARPIFRAWLRPFADMGASTITSTSTGGTDHLSFDAVGLPGFQFIQDPLEYDTRTHHSSMDVYDRVQADDARQASIIMASFVYHAAMRNEKLPRKPLDGDIVTP